MIQGQYIFADIPVQIESFYQDVHKLCKEYTSDAVPRYTIAVQKEDIDLERRHSAEEARVEGQALPILLLQTYRPRGTDAMQKVMELVVKLMQEVPVCELICNMEEDAAMTAYNALKGDKNEA